jgi:PAS domain S-box-containing protein
MSIRLKIAMVLGGAVILLGVVGYWLVGRELDHLHQQGLTHTMKQKASEVVNAIDAASLQARNQAAMFSTLPQVATAYQLALSGNIHDAASPQSQEARDMLRRDLAPVMDGFKSVTGQPLRLHFHLPNGRSLVRMWRSQQTKQNGKWIDISDDLSSFRQTVLDVNSQYVPMQGIELGRGGFAIRGLSPVKDDQGNHLGSVEVLIDFNPIMDAAGKGEKQDMRLYMNAEFLDITTRLQDPQKNPRIGNHFVLVAGAKNPDLDTLITESLLLQGKQGLVVEEKGNEALSAFPIRDYKGDQIGVMVYALDISSDKAIIQAANTHFSGILLALLVLPLLLITLLLTRSVIVPVKAIIAKIDDIRHDRANLSDRIDASQHDEIGELARSFNALMEKIAALLTEAQGYMYMLNAVPDPIFAVDDDFRILMANQATEKMLGKKVDQLLGTRCADTFRTEVCETPNCPITLAKKSQGLVQSEILGLGTPDKPIYVQPLADVIRDKNGQHIGYVEVAREVTDLVRKEQELSQNMHRLEDINQGIEAAAGHIADSADQFAVNFRNMSQGSEIQRNRVAETATAMEEMNATVLEVARGASSAAEQADAARQKAMAGSEIVKQAISAITEVQDKALVMKRNMSKLGEQAAGIGKVMNVINDIADQTNLLALNAAIEAARAGDAGRGFAVVADEVRKLAEKTMEATREVGEAIRTIQAGTENNVTDVDNAVHSVENATNLASQSGSALEEIVGIVISTNDQVQAIATAAEQQSATSEQISRAIAEVNEVADSTAQAIEESSKTLEELTQLARRLKDQATAP